MLNIWCVAQLRLTLWSPRGPVGHGKLWQIQKIKIKIRESREWWELLNDQKIIHHALKRTCHLNGSGSKFRVLVGAGCLAWLSVNYFNERSERGLLGRRHFGNLLRAGVLFVGHSLSNEVSSLAAAWIMTMCQGWHSLCLAWVGCSHVDADLTGQKVSGEVTASLLSSRLVWVVLLKR